MNLPRSVVVLAVAFLTISLGGLVLLWRGAQPVTVTTEATRPADPGVAPTAAPEPQLAYNDAVVVDARVVPVRSSNLTFGVAGIPVTDILVQEGDAVVEAAPLIRLDTRELQLRVEEAKAAVDRARAEYSLLEEGATPAQVDQARAQLAQAEARLREVVGTVTEQDLAAARARLDEARTTLAVLTAGPRTEEVAVARAAVDSAEANLARERDTLSAAKTLAQSRMEQAANELRNAQDTYSQIYWQVRKQEDSLGDLDRQEAKNREAAAQRAVQNAEKALDQSRVIYEDAQRAERSGLRAAEAQLREAQARLDLLLADAAPDDLARARAQVAEAEANLAKLQGESRAGTIAGANADIAATQARLDDLLADPSAGQLARAAATVTELEVGLKRQQLILDQATLYSPMTGTVAEVNVAVGEVPTDNTIAAVIADFSEWQLETEDLNELNIVRIRNGSPVIATFDALPDLELTGTVTSIKPLGKSAQGDTIYTVTIAFDQQDERLRWNMVSRVTILPGN